MIPQNIALHKKSRQLELQYDGEKPLVLDAEYLRVYSPSAEVRGHHPAQAVLQHSKKNVGIESVSPVGNYALQIHFDDNHSSGIYSWDYLHQLGVEKERYWQDYLQRLAAEGQSRDPEIQVVNLIDPGK